MCSNCIMARMGIYCSFSEEMKAKLYIPGNKIEKKQSAVHLAFWFNFLWSFELKMIKPCDSQVWIDWYTISERLSELNWGEKRQMGDVFDAISHIKW